MCIKQIVVEQCIKCTNESLLFVLSWAIEPKRIEEIFEIIKLLPKHKAPGIDRICHATLKVLPIKAIIYTALIFNAILRIQVFPRQWKMAAILLIHKPGKPEDDPESQMILPF